MAVWLEMVKKAMVRLTKYIENLQFVEIYPTKVKIKAANGSFQFCIFGLKRSFLLGEVIVNVFKN